MADEKGFFHKARNGLVQISDGFDVRVYESLMRQACLLGED